MPSDKNTAAGDRFDHQLLTEFSVAVLQQLKVPASDAREVADNLVLAELRGVDSHGLIRLPVYSRRLKAGAVKARPKIEIQSDKLYPISPLKPW